MTIGFTNGSITTTASEQTIFDVVADEHAAAWIFAHNMTSAESVVIKIYTLDVTSAVTRLYESVTLSGVQSKPAFYIPFIAGRQYKITIQRTAGTDKTFNWLRAEVT